jgi:TonB family protein
MRALSLHLRGTALDEGLEPPAGRQAAVVSVLGHAGVLSAMIVFPLLGATEPPETVSAFQNPLIRPLTVALPAAAQRPVVPAPKRSVQNQANQAAPAANVRPPSDTPTGFRVDDVLDPGPGTSSGAVGEDGGDRRGAPGGDCELGALCGVGLPSTAGTPEPTIARIGGLIREPRLIESRPPQYPSIAQTAGVSGKVVLEAHVAADGRVLDVQVITGHPLFDAAAIASVRSRRYEPLLLNGVPTEFLVTITVVFNARR